jgi:hypothetical protein
MERDEYDDIMRTLVWTLAHLDQVTEHQRSINERLTAAIERLDITQARTLTLLARLLRTEDTDR